SGRGAARAVDGVDAAAARPAWQDASMSGLETRQRQIDRLAARGCAGEGGFFIGAGFSLGSEGNTTGLLIARLLAPFEAMAEQAGETGERLRRGLRATFALEPNAAPDSTPSDLFDNRPPEKGGDAPLTTTVRSLSQNYYVINDWICSAFDTLINCAAANARA